MRLNNNLRHILLIRAQIKILKGYEVLVILHFTDPKNEICPLLYRFVILTLILLVANAMVNKVFFEMRLLKIDCVIGYQ